MFRTQKARGIELLSSRYGGIDFLVFDPQRPDYVNGFIAENGSLFARPCPIRPRHGFVDSRLIHSPSELRALGEEVLKHDPDGEIVLMNFIQSQYSGVLTQGLCVIGPGNDGVTAGREGCFKFPMIPMKELDSLAKEAKLEGAPYIEFVNKRLVQLRDGPPAIEMIGDVWAQKQEHVFRAISPIDSESLIEWETRVSELLPGEGVWLPGQTPLSHYAVHAICAGRPIFFGMFEPTFPIDVVPTRPERKYTKEHDDALRKGIQRGRLASLNTNEKRRCAAFVATLAAHHGSALIDDPNGCYIIGLGSALLTRLGYSALLGEWRHRDQLKVERKDIYEKSLDSNWESQTDLIHQCVYDFEYKAWRGGYGGAPWARCGAAALQLAKAIRQGEGADYLLRSLNVAVHVAHNNGKWLDKFFDMQYFDLIASGNLPQTIQAIGCVWGFLKTNEWDLPDISEKTYHKFFCTFDGAFSEDDEEHEDDEESEDDESSSEEETTHHLSAQKRIQWVVRKNHIHFQHGTAKYYRKFDLNCPSGVIPTLVFEEHVHSLADSPTRYRTQNIEAFISQAESLGLTSLIEWIKNE